MSRMATIYSIAAAIIAFMLLIILTAPSDAADRAELEKLQKQVLGVTVQLNGNCSGTIIQSKRDNVSGEVTTLVLSAGHCVTEKGTDQRIEIPVYQANEIVKREAYVGKVYGVYFGADLSLWKLKDKQTFFPNVAKLAPEKPELLMGEDVWTAGYPLGGVLTVTKGLFGSMETSDFAKPGMVYYRATPDIAPGSSGGALYHKNAAGDFELLGVTTAGARGFPYVALYTRVSDIYAYLKVAAPEIVSEPKKEAAKP